MLYIKPFFIRFGYTNVVRHTEKAHTQTAHLVFADPKANAEKPKELFFANADEIKNKK